MTADEITALGLAAKRYEEATAAVRGPTPSAARWAKYDAAKAWFFRLLGDTAPTVRELCRLASGRPTATVLPPGTRVRVAHRTPFEGVVRAAVFSLATAGWQLEYRVEYDAGGPHPVVNTYPDEMVSPVGAASSYTLTVG